MQAQMNTCETPGHEQWVVVDVQVPGDYQVVVGSRLATGRSLSRVRPPAGRLLPGAIGKVARTGKPLMFLSSAIHNVSYQVQATPILGPLGDIYAVACALAPDGRPLPEPPPSGGWEWDITTRMGRATRQLFDVTRTPPGLRKAQFSMVEYAGSLTVPARFSAANLWARMTKATNDELVFDTLLGEGEHPYLVCGRPEFDGDTPVAFRGVTVDLTDVLPMAAEEPTADDLLVAVLSHSDRPLAVVDLADLHLMHWLTPPAAGVQWPPDPYLPEIVHPVDRSTLEAHTWLNAAGAAVADPSPIVVRLPAACGGWVTVELDARRYMHEDTGAARVVVSVRVMGE